jgi:hypothetical protein
MIEAALARCNEKIAQSILLLECPNVDSGGYTVHLHPDLLPTNNDITINIPEGIISQ